MGRQKSDDPHFRLRLPADLKRRVEASAAVSGRSINAEIVQVLEQYFPPEPTDDDLLDAIETYVLWSKNPEAPAYRRRLLASLNELHRRLSVGIDFERPPAHRILTPAEVDLRKQSRNSVEMQWELNRQSDRGPVAAETFAQFLEDGLVHRWSTDERPRRALELARQHDLDGALSMIGLRRLKFDDPKRALAALTATLEGMVDGDASSPPQSTPEPSSAPTPKPRKSATPARKRKPKADP